MVVGIEQVNFILFSLPTSSSSIGTSIKKKNNEEEDNYEKNYTL